MTQTKNKKSYNLHILLICYICMDIKHVANGRFTTEIKTSNIARIKN